MLKRNYVGKLLCFGILVIGIFLFTSRGTAQAATYETVGGFIEKLMSELNLTPGNDVPASALDAGLITDTELKNWTKTLTRADAAVYLDRADAILHKDSVSSELATEILEKRISDIDSIPEAKQEGVARAYARGLIKGYSNGKYSTDREFRGNKKVSVGVADGWIALLKDTKSRFQISPDGQVIRTTKLPSNAELYPYILESYPNEYYDWEFHYMKSISYYEDPKDPNYMIGIPWMYHPDTTYLKDYASPVDIRSLIYDYGWWDNDKPTLGWNDKDKVKISTNELIGRGLNAWVQTAKTYLQCTFSYDYKTVKAGDDWYKTMLSVMDGFGNYSGEYDQRELNYYLDNAYQNKVSIEVDNVAIDGSSLYWDHKSLCLRAYVHYRFTSVLDPANTSALMFVPGGMFGSRNIENIRINEWRDGYFDIVLSSTRSNDAADFGIETAYINDYYHNNNILDDWTDKGVYKSH